MTTRLQPGPRLPARRWRPGEELIYRGLVRPALRASFEKVLFDERATFLDGRRSVLSGSTPILCVAAHPSWWDGYLALLLARAYRRAGHLMMEEAQLRRYGFFRWAGCFSVDRDDPREALRSLRYAAQRLQAERRALVWIFPQGEILPVDQRPIPLYRGAAEIAIRSDGVWCVPIALRYEFGLEQRPLAMLTCGTPIWGDRRSSRDTLHAQLTAGLHATADDLAARWNRGDLSGFRTILAGRTSTNRRFDQAMAPLRALLKPPRPDQNA